MYTRETTNGTFPDTVIFLTNEDPTVSSFNLQEHLNLVGEWLRNRKNQAIQI